MTMPLGRSVNVNILNFISSATGSLFYAKSEKFVSNPNNCNVILTNVCSCGKL